MRKKIVDAPLPEKPKAKGRRSKQNDGLRFYKDKIVRKRANILRYTRGKLMDGYERAEIIQMVQDEYGVTESTAARYYQRANELVTMELVIDSERIRNKNLQRLDIITEETMEGEDYQNAIKAISEMNKAANVYIDKKEINLEGTDIQFTFGKQE